MHIMRNLCDKWTADICPNIQKRLEITKDQHRFWHVIPTGGNLFEVRNGSEAFGVDEERRNCSCRLWQLSGLPCCHAIAVIFKLNRMVEDYVPDCYRKQAFYDTYHQYLTPVGGMTFWPDCSDMSRVLPPKPRTMPGRPKKKRIRAAHENKNPNKVSKAGVTMTCTNCHQKGHNKKGCKNPTVVLPPKPPTKKGRPRKTPVVGSSLIDEEIETPAVDEQVGVEEQASQYDVGGSSQFDVRGEEQASQYDVGGSRYKRGSVPSRRFSNLGRWFGLGEKAAESDPIENSEMAQETNQNAANDSFAATQETHQFSATAFASTQNSQNHQVSEQEPQAAEQEPQAAEQEPQRARPRGILNFIRPRPRSERILKKQLGKKCGEWRSWIDNVKLPKKNKSMFQDPLDVDNSNLKLSEFDIKVMQREIDEELKAERLNNLMAWNWDAFIDLSEDVVIVIDDESDVEVDDYMESFVIKDTQGDTIDDNKRPAK
ncbi:pentatricopeptide repeat-containing protein [Tanacetum coccineum]